MPINRRDERQDNLNKHNEYERGDVDYNPTLDLTDRLGWVSTPDAIREEHYKLYNFEYLNLPPPLTLEEPLPWPGKVDGQSVVDAYDQVGGTCVGASGAQATTGRHERRNPGAGEKFDYIALYCKCRAIMGDGGCNKNAGATMQSVGKALQNWGGAQVIGGKTQPALAENGILSYSWGYNVDAIRTAIGNGIYVQIGISVYQAMLSPKLINNEWWMYWQTGSWGSMLGGHAMCTFYWSDRRDAFWLPNTWGYEWCDGKGAWLSRASMTRLMGAAQPGEILLCVDRGVPAPVGKLELQKFFIMPALPAVGDKVQFTLVAKNTGAAPLIGIQLGIEEKHDDVYPDGYRGPVVDLAPGDVTLYSPVSAPLTAGHWRWRADNLKPYTVLSTLEFDVTDAPPPPPPGDDILTIKDGILIDQKTGAKYTPDIDQPDGVVYRKVQP